MRSRALGVALLLPVVLALALTGCSAARIVATGSDEAARAAASAIRGSADDAARATAPIVLNTDLNDLVALRAATAAAVDEAVLSNQWQSFKAQFAAKVRVTRESEICQPVLDLVFAEDEEDVINALYSLSEEASAIDEADEFYQDVNDLIVIWEEYDPSQPDKTFVAVGTALFQDFYCTG